MKMIRITTSVTAALLAVTSFQLFSISDNLTRLNQNLSAHVGHTSEATGIAIRTSDYTTELLRFLLSKENGDRPAITEKLFNSLHDEPGLYHDESGWHSYKDAPEAIQHGQTVHRRHRTSCADLKLFTDQGIELTPAQEIEWKECQRKVRK